MITGNYDSLQKVWDIEHSLGPTHLIKDKLLSDSLRHVRDCVVLDVGSGNGYFTRMLERSNTVFAIDISLHAVKITKESRCQSGNNLVASAEKLPFRNNVFDAVVCFDVIEHIRNPHALLEEFKRVLKTGGGVYFSIPEDLRLYSWIDKRDGHFKRYSQREVVDLFNGFRVVHLTDYGFPFMKLYYKLLPHIYSGSGGNVGFLKLLGFRIISFFIFLVFHIDFLFAGNFKGCQIIGCVRKVTA